MRNRTLALVVTVGTIAAAGIGWWSFAQMPSTGAGRLGGQGGASRPVPFLVDERVPANQEILGPPRFKTNSRGYRGVDVAVPKPKDTVRIAIVGGPFAFGRDAASEADTVAGQLQSRLVKNVNNKTIEAVNAGTGAPGPSVARAIVDHDLGLDVQPDLLAWIVEPDGAAWAGKSPASDAATASRPAPPSLAFGTEAWSHARDGLARAFASDAKAGRLEFRPDVGLADVERVAALCKERKIQLVVAVLAHPLEADDELRALFRDALERELGGKPPAPDEFDSASRLAAAIRAKGISTLDLTAELREATDLRKDVLLDYTTGRWNEKTAGLVGAAFGRHVILSNLLSH